jgi:hypothetical protein
MSPLSSQSRRTTTNTLVNFEPILHGFCDGDYANIEGHVFYIQRRRLLLAK